MDGKAESLQDLEAKSSSLTMDHGEDVNKDSYASQMKATKQRYADLLMKVNESFYGFFLNHFTCLLGEGCY